MTNAASSTAIPETGIRRFGDPIVLVLSVGFILLFLGLSLDDIEWTAGLISEGFAWTAKYLGSYFQLLLLLTFLIGLGVAVSPAGSAKVNGSPRIFRSSSYIRTNGCHSELPTRTRKGR